MLRAMVIFSAAGLDSALKYLLRDALPVLIYGGHPRAIARLGQFAERQLGDDPKQIARILAEPDPQGVLIGRVVGEETRRSLQSWEEMNRIAAYFGISDGLTLKRSDLQPAIDCRNQIAHELDVDFESAAIANRRPRPLATMIGYASVLLDAGSTFVEAVDRIPSQAGHTDRAYDVPENRIDP